MKSQATAMPELVIKKNRVKIGETLRQRAYQKIKRRKFVVFCFILVFLYMAIALMGYLDFLPDFQERVGESYQPPSLEFSKLLGTDIFGRSILYKILVGTKTAMTIGLVVTGLAIPIGVAMGSIAGYFGGKVDAVVMWLYSVISSVPDILLTIGIAYVFGKGVVSVCLALAAVNWIGLCRLIRGEVMKHRDREYVLAIRLLGASHFRAIFHHILPNVMHLAIITTSLTILNAIKAEVVLTFLGVGIQDGSSWGTMIADATGELRNEIWWPLAGVTLVMFVVIYSLNIVGDALRDALDPKLVD